MASGAWAATAGFRVEHFNTLASTNDLALERARAGDPGRLWIVADSQTGGRGRLGRVWASPPGNLHASLLLVDPAPQARAAELGFVTGVALAAAFEAVGVAHGAITLKWPNDALFNGAKISGVLLEATTTPTGSLACVIGVGVNCGWRPEGLPYRATSLAAEGLAVSAAGMFDALAEALAGQLEVWAGGAGFPEIRSAWQARAAGLGSRIEVALGDRKQTGVFRGIDGEGRLLLVEGAEEFTISAGDVLLASRITPHASGDREI